MTGSDQLAALSLPAVDGDWMTWLEDRCRTALGRAKKLRTEVATADPDATLEVWNRLHTELANAFAVAGLLAQVHPDHLVREQAEQLEVQANAFHTDLMLDVEVFDGIISRDGNRVLA